MKTKITGTRYFNYLPPTIDEFLFMVKEPNNAFDSNAIAIYNKHNQQIGYIPKDKTLLVHKRLNGQPVEVITWASNQQGKSIVIDIEFNDKKSSLK